MVNVCHSSVVVACTSYDSFLALPPVVPRAKEDPPNDDNNILHITVPQKTARTSSVVTLLASCPGTFLIKDKKKQLKKTRTKLMRATLLKEGNCACALRRCTCGKKKHITQAFFGISE